jgi:hypothetical protein
MKKALVLILSFVLAALGLQAQSNYAPLGGLTYDFLDRIEIKSGRFLTDVHTTLKPYQREDIVKSIYGTDTLSTKPSWTKMDEAIMNWLHTDNNDFSGKSDIYNSKKPLFGVFYQNKANFYGYNSDEFTVRVDPVINFGLGNENDSQSGRKFNNTRGIEVRGNISRKLGFYFYAGENQMRPADYVRAYINPRSGIPNAGYYKAFKETGYDYFNGRGNINFKALKPVTLTFGVDRNFIGNGYRSLFLSDFSNDYLFLKIQTKVWRINYTNLYIQGIENYEFNKGDNLLKKRFASMHHLSTNLTKWLNIGLFEGVVFSRTDGYELQYLNPIIFFRSVEQQLGSPDNSVMGFDFKVNAAKHVQLYGQVLIDDLSIANARKNNGWWGNKWGVQTGVKYVDAFFIKNLDLQMEVNMVRPYTYTHHDSITDYTNYNLPFAHPLGANFREFVGVARYQPIKNLYVQLRAISYLYGADEPGKLWGGNIRMPSTEKTIVSSFGNKIGQGVPIKTLNLLFTISYQLRHNLFTDFNMVLRRSENGNTGEQVNTNLIMANLRWNFPTRFYDF